MPHTTSGTLRDSLLLETRPEPTKTGFEERDPKKDNPFRVGTPEYKEQDMMRGWREDARMSATRYKTVRGCHPEFGVGS